MAHGLVTLLQARAGTQDLQVIHHQQIEVSQFLFPLGLHAQLLHRGTVKGKRQRQAAHLPAASGQLAPFLLRQRPSAQPGAVDARKVGGDAVRVLHLTHFAAAHQHMPSLPGGIDGDLHAKGGFAHRGPRADHRQIARFQTEDQAVKIRNSGQNACHFAAGPPFHIVVYAAGQLVHAHNAPGRSVQTAQSGAQRVGAGVHVLALGQLAAKRTGHGIGAPGPAKAP